MKVGGREFNQGRIDVERAMRGEKPEEIRKYLVEVNGEAYPPKQVLARATGWERQSFTTMEAQRVLNKLGFRCRDAVTPSPPGPPRATAMEERIEALAAALATAQAAIAGLDARLRLVEAGLEPNLERPGGSPVV